MTKEERDVRLCLSRYEYALSEYKAVSLRRLRPYAYFLCGLAMLMIKLSVFWAIVLGVVGTAIFTITLIETKQAHHAWTDVKKQEAALMQLVVNDERYQRVVQRSVKFFPGHVRKQMKGSIQLAIK